MLKVENLSKRFGGVIAVDGCSFEIAEGTITGLIGPNGADPNGEKVGPGEWAKAKKLIDDGKPINYEGASGSCDFDENGDVPGTYAVNVVGDHGKWQKKLLK